ncbi:hypothetical protein B0H19DRAFT_1200314 [Mycena capillaripes]|nr:hypothetical protein B0H19DRAFT_1200314 [Mycena capillaripes]
MKFSESSSAYLVVSKAWLRVATPLLYNVVAIHLKAQAQALAATLTTNPALGRFIMKSRNRGWRADMPFQRSESSRPLQIPLISSPYAI